METLDPPSSNFLPRLCKPFLRNGHFNDSPIPKISDEGKKRLKTFFFFDSSFVLSFVALFIVRCIEILRCKKSHSRFFMIFALSRSLRGFFLLVLGFFR